MVYNENGKTSIITTEGQCGAPIQMHYGENIKTDDVYTIVGVHVASEDGDNFGTLISKMMFLDYIIPTVVDFQNEYGSKEKDRSYKSVIMLLKEKFKFEIEEREAIR